MGVKSGWSNQDFARQIRDVVTRSINDLDPIQLIKPGVNDDEYSGEISFIVSRLAIRQDVPTLAEIQELIAVFLSDSSTPKWLAQRKSTPPLRKKSRLSGLIVRPTL